MEEDEGRGKKKIVPTEIVSIASCALKSSA